MNTASADAPGSARPGPSRYAAAPHHANEGTASSDAVNALAASEDEELDGRGPQDLAPVLGLESRWASEQRDESANDQMESRVLAALANLELDPGLMLGVDCRSSLCRLEFDLSERDAFTALNDALQQDGMHGEQLITTLDSGRLASVLYLASDRPPHDGR